MNSNLDSIIKTVRQFISSFGAFQLVYDDGSVVTCKTPLECETGLYSLLYMKKHPETYKKVNSIKIPEEDGTFFWMKEAYGREI